MPGCVVGLAITAFPQTFDEAHILWNMNIGRPSLMKCGAALLPKPASQEWIGNEPVYGIQEMLLVVECHSAPAFGNNLRHSAYVSNNDRRCTRKRFKNDDAEHLIPKRRD